MRWITIAAISAAAVAGLVAAFFLGYVPASRSLAESESDREQNSTLPTLPETPEGDYRKISVTVNGVQLVADVAATSEQRNKGLAVKDSLGENESMLFVFSKANDYHFWMKDMKFPIDIIWLDSDRKVIHIQDSLEPCAPDGDCPTYGPGGEAQYVLETVAGFAKKYDITIGTVVEFDPASLR